MSLLLAIIIAFAAAFLCFVAGVGIGVEDAPVIRYQTVSILIVLSAVMHSASIYLAVQWGAS